MSVFVPGTYAQSERKPFQCPRCVIVDWKRYFLLICFPLERWPKTPKAAQCFWQCVWKKKTGICAVDVVMWRLPCRPEMLCSQEPLKRYFTRLIRKTFLNKCDVTCAWKTWIMGYEPCCCLSHLFLLFFSTVTLLWRRHSANNFLLALRNIPKFCFY